MLSPKLVGRLVWKYIVALYPGCCGQSRQTSTRQQCFWSSVIQRAARSLCRHRWSPALKDYSTNRCCSGPLPLSPWFREGQHERKCTHLLAHVMPPQVNGLYCWALSRSVFWSFPFNSRFEAHDLILTLFIYVVFLFLFVFKKRYLMLLCIPCNTCCSSSLYKTLHYNTLISHCSSFLCRWTGLFGYAVEKLFCRGRR